MLSGEAVVAIWNGIAPEAWDDFHDWHMREHMSERVGIPGFIRGRRYAAADRATTPEFFTLYEALSMQVLQGAGYTDRLNAPTPWTRRVTPHFTATARALARVLSSSGPGMGGVLATIRFDAPAEAATALSDAVQAAGRAPRITGAHLCRADDDASGLATAESRARSDSRPPPAWFVLLEAVDLKALDGALPDAALHAAGPVLRGQYQLQYVRTKTAFT